MSQDPSQLRISDDERHRVAEILREAAGEGRLDLDELDERLEATYKARTYADLVPITLDLPGQGHQPAVPYSSPTPQLRPDPALVVAGPVRENHLCVMSGLDRKGIWVVPRDLSILAVMGGADLDLREARFAAREVTITVNCFMGGANIKVGPNVHVVMGGTGIMGAFSGPSGDAYEADASSPVVHVRGVAVWGGVNVERKD